MSLLLVPFVLVFQTIAADHVTYNRIIGGEVTSINKYPHQASLQKDDQHLCGAVIVGPQYALTAAHCLRYVDAKGKKIRVGTSRYNSGGDSYEVESFAFHPRHNYIPSDMDIGVIKLKQSIAFNDNVRPITIVPENQEPGPGTMVTVTGWGVSDFSSRNSSEELRVIRIPVITRSSCASVYEEWEEVTITQNMLCAGGSSKSVYSGDSGGPLIDSEKQLVGIVSWGRKNENLGFPSVFTNIASPGVRKFIKDQTNL